MDTDRTQGSSASPTLAAQAAEHLRRARRRVAPRGSARARLIDTILDARDRTPKTTRPGQDLRILIAGPPKSGNMWIKCLLANIYGLRWIVDDQGPDTTSVADFRAFVDRGAFEPGTIFHRHYRYSPDLVALARAVPCHLVTMIRDPYDLFVSSYYHYQNFPDRFQREGDQRARVIGKPLDDPDVLRLIELRFGGTLRRADQWVTSGQSIVVRYEDLHRDAVAELTRVTDLIRPVARPAVEQAVEACSVDRMRQMSGNMAKHVRAATVGDSRQKLGPEHLAIFRERHAHIIRRLGYEVR